jgi:hypothetical protein
LVIGFNTIFYKNSFKYYEQINYFFFSLLPILATAQNNSVQIVGAKYKILEESMYSMPILNIANGIGYNRKINSKLLIAISINYIGKKQLNDVCIGCYDAGKSVGNLQHVDVYLGPKLMLPLASKRIKTFTEIGYYFCSSKFKGTHYSDWGFPPTLFDKQYIFHEGYLKLALDYQFHSAFYFSINIGTGIGKSIIFDNLKHQEYPGSNGQLWAEARIGYRF